MRRPELGRTLQRIAQGGPKEFYEGPLARDIVADLQEIGWQRKKKFTNIGKYT